MVRDVFIEEIEKRAIGLAKNRSDSFIVFGIGRRISLFRDVFPFLLGFGWTFRLFWLFFYFPPFR